MAKIPKQDDIDFILNHEPIANLPRPYLGLSQIGHSCHRYLQYYHYWAYTSEIDARIQRLFNFGHMMEDQITADLERCEIFIQDTQSEVIGTAGHWKGHSDGKAISSSNIGEQFLVEYKTHNDKNFKILKKDGVLKGYPVHYDQVTSYMGYEELPWCLYVGYNKNDSEYYYETIQFDPERFRELKRKEVEIIASDVLLPRIGNGTASWFECKMCDAKKVCFGRELPPVTCRTCKNVDVLDGGRWLCRIGRGEKMAAVLLSVDEQKKACDQYELGEMFR